MAKKFIQEGKILQYLNETGATIIPDSVVFIHGLPGIALVNLADGETGSVQVQGVCELPKHNNATPANGTAFAAGDVVRWDGAQCVANPVYPQVGFAIAAAAGDATVVNVLLAGDPADAPIPVIAGAAITKGQLLYVKSFNVTHGKFVVDKADADAAAPANAALLVALTDIADTVHGYAGRSILLAAQNTNSVTTAGDPLYLSTTPGAFTHAAPTGGGHTVQMVGVAPVKSDTVGTALLCPGMFKVTTVNTTTE